MSDSDLQSTFSHNNGITKLLEKLFHIYELSLTKGARRCSLPLSLVWYQADANLLFLQPEGTRSIFYFPVDVMLDHHSFKTPSILLTRWCRSFLHHSRPATVPIPLIKVLHFVYFPQIYRIEIFFLFL